MEHILTFDIETTGIPSERNITPTADNTNIWDNARVIQLAYVIGDPITGVVVKESSHLILPSGTFHISPENSKIHGYSADQVLQGVEIQSVLSEMYADFSRFKVSKMVSHNIAFDYNVLLSEIMRCGMLGNASTMSSFHFHDLLSAFSAMQKYCTMQNSCDITKLSPKRWGAYKYPKLVELCHHFNIPVESNSLHSALYDAKKAWECFLALLHHRTRNCRLPV
tara:strand:- start:835 stop:1503 length:669 start_codon:yes stop_codon:yes gene_type:complete